MTSRKQIVDVVNPAKALRIVNQAVNRKEPPMATCPKDGEPLVFTFEFPGAEFYCVICDTRFGFLSPTPKPVTPELEARLAVLQEQYDQERKERAGAE